MSITPKNCDISVKKAIQQLSQKAGIQGHPVFAGLTLLDLTASSLIGTNASKALESVIVSTGLKYDRPDLTLSHLGIESLTDPGADRIMFWDDNTTAVGWLAVGNSLVITATTIDTIQDIQTSASPIFVGLTLSGLTNNSLIYPSSGVLTSLGVATNGQLPIGSTGTTPVLATLTGTTDHISVSNGAGSITLDLDTNTQTLLGSFNGIFLEKLNFTISEAAGTVTGSLEKDGTGDLIQRFSDGYTVLDCTPAKTINLTGYVGTNAVPKEVFVYILQSAKTVIAASNSDWPATEHIKIANLLLKSATTTGTDGGALVNRNWNDFAFGSDSQGHITHIEKRIRQNPTQWDSGVALTLKDSGGSALTTGNSSTAVEIVTTAGKVYQLHRHTFPAFDMYTTATDDAHVVNQPTDEGGAYETTADLVADVTHYVDGSASGVAIGTNKYFNLIVWGVQNRSGEPSHIMINLPTGQYTNEADATSDIDGTSIFDIPVAFKGTGFLIARLTFRRIAGVQWTYIAQEDLRGQFPTTSAGVGVGTTDHALLANLTFAIAGHTGFQAQGDVLDDLNTLGAVGADSEFLVGTGVGTLAWESGATARASLGAPGNDTEILFNDGGTFGADSNLVFSDDPLVHLEIVGHLWATGIIRSKGYELAGNPFTGSIELWDEDNSNYFALRPATTTTQNVEYRWPPADGDAGSTLSTNGSGVLSWVVTNVPAGNDRYVQYNANGSFGGSGSLYFEYGSTPPVFHISGITKIHPHTGAVGELRFHDLVSSDYVGFKAPDVLAVTHVWALPTADGPANEVWGTDGSGNLIWRTHDEISGFVANEHIDHTAVTLTAGTGLTGGGDISANRTFAVDGVLEDLDTLGAAAADGQFIVATGAGVFAYEATTVVRTSLGLGTGDSPQFTGIELGHASDTTITRASAGNLNIEGNLIYRAGGTDVPIGDGGTGQSTAQLAINALSAVSGATNEHVLTKDTGTGNAIWKAPAGNGASTWIALTDTDPANYTGQAGNTVVVNAGEDGLEFGAAPGGAFTSKIAVHLSGNQSIAHNTFTVITFDVEDYDTDGEFAHDGNHQFHPDVTGYYHITLKVYLVLGVDNKIGAAEIRKNGARIAWQQLPCHSAISSAAEPGLSIDLYLLNTDYIEFIIYHNALVNKNLSAGVGLTFASIHRFA